MIRPFTLLTFGAAALAGLQMFQIKAGVTALEREIREVNRQVEAARTRTEILRAEWALLNEPSRLLALARQHLALEPIRPDQFARLSDLPQRAPQPIAFVGPVTLFPEARPPAAPATSIERTFALLALREAAAARPPPGVALASLPAMRTEPAEPAGLPAPPPPAPGTARLALSAAAPTPPAEPALRLASAGGPPPRRIEAETLAAPPGARTATRPAAPPRTDSAPPAARPGPPPAATAPAAAPPPRIAAAPPAGASMLGGAGSLPPPVPRPAAP
jgi:hypothetical protein